MELKDILAFYKDQELFIRQGNKWGTTGSEPVFHFHLTSGSIPTKLLNRKVKLINAVVVERYGRKTGALEIILQGYEE